MSFLVSRQLIKRISQPTFVKCSIQNSKSTFRRSYATTQQQTGKEQPVSRTKQFMKKYGYVGIGVYLALGAVDLAATMAFISVKGANRVREVEDYVIGKAKGVLGMEHTPIDLDKMKEKKPSFTSIFVLAYGIHKTVLLPFRLSLTAAITPAIAKRLVKLGWVQKKFINKK
jgi:hypothetical protein